jgi:hypothetical protein
MAEREYGTPSIQPHRWNWWAGDVWRTLWVLKRHRPDLSFTVLDAPPTGLVLITNLDPSSTLLRDNYAALTREMFSLTLPEVGLARLMAEMQVEPTSALNRPEQITARFWL